MIVKNIVGVTVTLTSSEGKLLDSLRKKGETREQAFQRIIKGSLKRLGKTEKSF